MNNNFTDGTSRAQQAQTQNNQSNQQAPLKQYQFSVPSQSNGMEGFKVANDASKDDREKAASKGFVMKPGQNLNYNAEGGFSVKQKRVENQDQQYKMKNNQNLGLKEGDEVNDMGFSSGVDDEPMTPPNERPKRFAVQQYFKDQLSVQNLGKQQHMNSPQIGTIGVPGAGQNEFGLNSQNSQEISASMYLFPYGKSESVQAKKNPLIFQKGSPIEKSRSNLYGQQKTVQQKYEQNFSMNAMKGNGLTQDAIVYGKEGNGSSKIKMGGVAVTLDQQNTSQNQRTVKNDNILITKLNNVTTSAAEGVGEKVGNTQVKTQGMGDQKICSFMEEDNFVNSMGVTPNKQSFQNGNLNIDKINVTTLPGTSLNPNLQSRFGLQVGNQLKGSQNSSQIPKIPIGLQGGGPTSTNPHNPNAWLSPESITGNSAAAFTINQTNLPGPYGMQGPVHSDSRDLHQVVIEESDESSSKKPSSDETAKKESDESHKSLNQNTDGPQIAIGQSLKKKVGLLFQSEENKEYKQQNSMNNDKQKGNQLNQHTDKSPKEDNGLWNPFTIIGANLNIPQPEVSNCSSQQSKRITYSINFQHNIDMPSIKRQDTPGFLTSQQMNLRRMMRGNGEESVSASISIHNPDNYSPYSGFSLCKPNFTIGANMISPQDLGFIEASLNPQQFQELQDNKMIFVTQEDILGSKKILYTNLDYDINIMNRKADEINLNTDRYKKTSPKKLTLVLEMVDILLKVIDINSREQLCLLHDQSMHQIAIKSATIPNSFEVIVTRFMKTAMIKSLKELQNVCELVLFTYLPKNFVDELLKVQLPELREIFSFIICDDEMVEVGDFRIKDLSILLKSRNSADIVIVDTLAERIDEEIFSSIIVSEYNGTVAYTNQLILLKTTLKQINDQDLLAQQQQQQQRQQMSDYNQNVQPDDVIQKKQGANETFVAKSEAMKNETSGNNLSVGNVELGHKTQEVAYLNNSLMNHNNNNNSSQQQQIIKNHQ